VTLCDANGPFLRRYTWLNGAASYDDFALDGATPHVVTGTVGACAGDSGTPGECAEPTTPAATLGLCLADGPPSPSSSPVTATALPRRTGGSTSSPAP
jgi:hypothetical protein